MKKLSVAVIVILSLALTACAGGSSHSNCEIWHNGGGPCGGSGL